MGNYPKCTESVPKTLNCRGMLLSLEKPLVMGILNVTDDSFFDGGRYTSVEAALKQAETMIREGAAIIDAGGQSTRPGAEIVSAEEELRRILPVVEALHNNFPGTVISIDTFRASVAKAAVEAGASIVNDISAGDDDAAMLSTVAALNVPYIAMHKQGTPQTMQKNPQYENVTKEVLQYFTAKIKQCEDAGIKDIITDPGFGFGKNLQHNYTLLSELESFSVLGKPVLVGVSRKSMVWKLLGTDSDQALNGTIAANTIALLKGANILRVHDVKEAVQVVRIVEMVK